MQRFENQKNFSSIKVLTKELRFVNFNNFRLRKINCQLFALLFYIKLTNFITSKTHFKKTFFTSCHKVLFITYKIKLVFCHINWNIIKLSKNLIFTKKVVKHFVIKFANKIQKNTWKKLFLFNINKFWKGIYVYKYFIF